MKYNSQQLVARANITYRQLDHWVKRGYLEPEPDYHGGSGRTREFSREQLTHAVRLSKLVKAGFVPEAANRLSQQLAVWPVVTLADTGITLHFDVPPTNS